MSSTGWIPVSRPPDDDRQVRLGWFAHTIGYGHQLEYEKISRWLGDHWEGFWTPTHWRELDSHR